MHGAADVVWNVGTAVQVLSRFRPKKLDRGVIAVKADNGVFVSWRSLLGDSKDLLFDVYRDGSKINEAPLKVTNFTDPAGTPGAKYQVKAILNGTDIETSKEVAACAENFLRVHLNRPEGGTSPAGGRVLCATTPIHLTTFP